MAADVVVKVEKLAKFALDVEKAFRSPSSARPVRKAFKQWAAIYRSFAQLRYDTFSKGGGNWKPLKQSTVRRRRKQSSTILRDTNTMFRVLQFQFKKNPGQLEKNIRFGIEVGFGGPATHPKGKGRTIADIASYHQKGNDVLPQRKIIVAPDEKIVDKMVKVMKSAITISKIEAGYG